MVFNSSGGIASKDFGCARRLIAGIETMHMVKKGQLDCPQGKALSDADQFYSLAF